MRVLSWGAAAAALGAAVIAAPVFLGGAGEQVNPVQRLRIPSVQHPFGTDQLGRDLLARCIEGGQISLLVGMSVTLVALGLGTAVGLLALRARALDLVLMRVADGLMAIPAILIAVALVSVWGSSIEALILAIAVPEIPRVIRILRSALLALRQAHFVEAARMSGCGWTRLILVHLLPNAWPVLIVQATYTMANAILIESGLSFIGLGIPGETPSWGRIIAEGKLFFQLFPYQVLIPGLLLAATVWVINVLGDALRERLDPRLQAVAR
jgi:peptide/nickel transport system permease protein